MYKYMVFKTDIESLRT